MQSIKASFYKNAQIVIEKERKRLLNDCKNEIFINLRKGLVLSWGFSNLSLITSNILVI
jgi:hypothetical protein